VRTPRHPAIRTAVVVAVALACAVPSVVAVADPVIPSASSVAQARAKASSLAGRVGVMQAELVAAQAKLVALGESVDAASEKYDGAVYELGLAEAAAAAARRAAAGAQQQLNVAREQVGQLAAAEYQGQSMTLSVGALMTATSPQGLVDAISTLGVIANRQSAVLGRMKADQVVASVLDKQASAALAAQTKAAGAAAKDRASVQSMATAMQAQISAIDAQVAALTTALSAARSHSAQLSAARQAGLAAAAAAAAAANRPPNQSSGSHGGGPSGASGPGTYLGGNGNGNGHDTATHPSAPQGTLAGARLAVAYAEAQLGKPYQWGGAGPSAFDCSGLTMMAWAASGVALTHWTVAQWQESVPVTRAEARPGDLVFFAYNMDDYTSIHHVGLYIGNGLMIEAPYIGVPVRISSVDRPDLWGFGRP
jgi:peptidoglycan DL-endopeptidase CwlO